MQGQVIWPRAREKSVDAPLLVQSSSATLPNSRDHSCGRVIWQVLMRGKPFDHRCGRVAQLALERRRVQQRCPRGFSSAALGHRPQNRAKGADPRTGTPQRRNVFLPGCFVFSLSWPACGGAFLVPGRWFSGPAPSGSCLFLFRLMFLSTGRGRHVPAPGGRDVGSAQGHRPKNRPFPGIPLYAVRFNLDFAYGVASVLTDRGRVCRGGVRFR